MEHEMAFFLAFQRHQPQEWHVWGQFPSSSTYRTVSMGPSECFPTYGVHDEIELAIIDGHVDAGFQQLVHDADDGLHEVPLHVLEDIGRLAYT